VAEVRLRAAADADLAEILEYSIERWGEAVGEAYLAGFGEAFELLARHPLAGTLRADIHPPIRCLPHRSHRIFYDLDGETVWIVRVLHHALDVERWLSE
jgi:toxin ParE1/3/4